MRSLRNLLLCSPALLFLSLLSSCTPSQSNQNGGSPTPQPNAAGFVLAWTGPNNQIKTIESVDGLAWRRSNPDPQATTTSGDVGPAIAYGNFVWRLMWKDGGELKSKVGLGNPTTSTGITWAQDIDHLRVNTDASPALAFGNDRWVTVFRVSSRRLMVIRTDPTSGSWETSPTVVVHAGPIIPPTTAYAPGLTFGEFNGQKLFVLAYVDSTLHAVSATSSDGLTWSPASRIGVAEKDVALCTFHGRVYAVLSRGVGIGLSNFIFKSSDGVTWTEIHNYTNAPQNVRGPGLAYGVLQDGSCRMIVTEQIGQALGGVFWGISSRVASLNAPCEDPTSLSFTGDLPTRVAGETTNESVGSTGARTAVAFGRSGP